MGGTDAPAEREENVALEAWATLGIVVVVLVALVLEKSSADTVFLGALGVAVAAGLVPLDQALEGFANGTLVALGSLYVIAAAMRRTGILARVARVLLGAVSSVRLALARLILPVSLASAFLNNTPIVAMGIPAVRTWARDRELSPAKLLMPMSFASILGGMCTLMGTSTNLVAHGMLQDEGLSGFGFFELAGIGVPCTVVGWAYLVGLGPWVVRASSVSSQEVEEDDRPLLTLVIVEGAAIAGQPLSRTGLDALDGLALSCIDRGDERLVEPDGEVVLEEGDRLCYAAAETDTEDVDLSRFAGLQLKIADIEQLSATAQAARRREAQHSVALREGSRLVGRRVGDVDFAERYGAEPRAVRRGGEPVEADDLDDVVLEAGDTVMVSAGEGFRETFEDSPDFHITSAYTAEEEARATRQSTRQAAESWIVLGVMLAVVGLTTAGVIDIAVSALLGAALLVVTGIIGPAEARDAVDWEVLLVIGAALGLGHAMESSGAAEAIANLIIGAGQPLGPVGLLAGIVFGTSVLTQVITNNGAVALFFPIALSVATSEGIDARPLVVGMTAAGSMSLVSPFGYQTNLMVYSAGDYRFSDFPRAGAPLQLGLTVLVIALVPQIWPF